MGSQFQSSILYKVALMEFLIIVVIPFPRLGFAAVYSLPCVHMRELHVRQNIKITDHDLTCRLLIYSFFFLKHA